MTFAVLATGPSMSQATADAVRHLRCVAVNDAFRLAPFAEALAAQDPEWWQANPDAFDFTGDKYSMRPLPGVSAPWPAEGIHTQSSSGLLGMHIAIARGARRVLLLGFDGRGSHYFGAHAAPLNQTTQERFAEFDRQFLSYQLRGVEVLNCTPGSALRAFPLAAIEEVLKQ